jgi:hypothetical protein
MAGTIELTAQRVEGNVRWARFTCTADASDGSFPTPYIGSGLGCFIDGTILAVRTNPGATAPDDNIDIMLVDGDGVDRFGGACLNRDSSATETAIIGEAPFLAPDEPVALTITGNTTVDAVEVVTIYWTADVLAPGLSFTSGALDVADAATLLQLEAIAAAVHQEDDPHVSTDSLIGIHGVANEAGADLVDTDGDDSPISTTLKGEPYVRPTVKLVVKSWTPTLDTSAYGANDNLYTTLAEVTGAARYVGGSGRIIDFWVDDLDFQQHPCEAQVFDRSVTIPAANAAWSISDADALFRACAPIPSGGYSAATLNARGDNLLYPVPFQCKSDSTSLFVAVVTRGTPTYTATGVRFGFLIEQD